MFILGNSADPDEMPHFVHYYAVCLCSFFACIQPVSQVRTLNLRLATPVLNLRTNVIPTFVLVEDPRVGICNNPFKPNGASHHYHLDEQISKFRGAGCYFSFLFKF